MIRAHQPVYEVAVKKGAHAGQGGKVVGSLQTGSGLFYCLHFWNSRGELTAPERKDLVPVAFCKVVIEGGGQS